MGLESLALEVGGGPGLDFLGFKFGEALVLWLGVFGDADLAGHHPAVNEVLWHLVEDIRG